MKNYDVQYRKLNYPEYVTDITKKNLDSKLLKMGLSQNILGKTEYGYNVSAFSIGYGKKDIFVVGTTHGSEVIGLDFILQLIDNLSNMEEFDPNLYKITFIPLHNPEGFDISSSTYQNIEKSNFEKQSHEYYERYRLDSLINISLESLNVLIGNYLNKDTIIDANSFLEKIKRFIKTNKAWQMLSSEKGLPQLKTLNKYILMIESVESLNELKSELLKCAKMSQTNLNNTKDIYYKIFIDEFIKGFSNNLLWKNIDNINRRKLHQMMFKEDNFDNVTDDILKNHLKKIYDENQILPRGSQIIYDANGNGINLNANNEFNPGIELLKNNKTIYGVRPRDNVVRYFRGPIGAPTKDPYHFEYEKENIYLYNLLKESYDKGRYLCTLLYHGTGGVIYYQPNETYMDEEKYQEFMIYNTKLAEIYGNTADYKLLNNHDISGTGDLLRRTFPGVLLIELSKMGGNPIGPYGDIDNINRTINDNINAFSELLKYYNKLLSLGKRKIKKR